MTRDLDEALDGLDHAALYCQHQGYGNLAGEIKNLASSLEDREEADGEPDRVTRTRELLETVDGYDDGVVEVRDHLDSPRGMVVVELADEIDEAVVREMFEDRGAIEINKASNGNSMSFQEPLETPDGDVIGHGLGGTFRLEKEQGVEAPWPDGEVRDSLEMLIDYIERRYGS